MIKSTAVVLGFLFALSTAYYLSFWSFFDIDVFQYIAVSDIIKGIAYPLRFAGVGLLGLFAFVCALVGVSYIFDSRHVDRGAKLAIVLFLVVAIILLGALLFSATSNLLGVTVSIMLAFVLYLTYVAIDNHHSGETAVRAGNTVSPVQHPIAKGFELITIYCLIFFPINAIIAGRVDAHAIHSGTEYNYIVSADLPQDKIKTKKLFLIFLGAISEKYIFIDRQGDERYFINKDQLPMMRIHHFNYADTASVSILNRLLSTAEAKSIKGDKDGRDVKSSTLKYHSGRVHCAID
jgi:hypothetical protein